MSIKRLTSVIIQAPKTEEFDLALYSGMKVPVSSLALSKTNLA